MALAKKGARRIVIGDATYRWVVSPDDGYLVLVVQRAEGSGQRLEAFFSYDDIYETSGETGGFLIKGQRTSISPRIVRDVIGAALTNGWNPMKTESKPFRILEGEKLVAPRTIA